MEELLSSPQFAQYRQLMLTVLAEYIDARLFGNESDLREVKGAIELARQVIRLPLKIRQNDLTKQMVVEDLRKFEVNFIRVGLRSDPENETD